MDESIVGAEALARIATVESAAAAPGPWLLLAERLERIDALTLAIARSVAACAKAFLLAGAPLPVSINAGVDRLASLPFSEVKIDAAFTQLAMEEAFARKALDACVDIAGRQGLRVVAKGVETPEMWAFVQDLGVDAAQGFLLHRPTPADAFAAMLNA